MLKNRVVVAQLGNAKLKISTTRGCPQGGVLSPLLWCLVVDNLLRELNNNGFCAYAYADYISILISGKFCDTLSEISQNALNMVQDWCTSNELCINYNKSETVLFTRNLLVYLN